MKLKLTSIFIACGLAMGLCGDLTSAAPKPSKLESYQKWLQGDWGQMHQDGSAVEMRGCELKSTTPDSVKNILKVRYDLPASYFYRGSIAFGLMEGNLHAISN